MEASLDGDDEELIDDLVLFELEPLPGPFLELSPDAGELSSHRRTR